METIPLTQINLMSTWLIQACTFLMQVPKWRHKRTLTRWRFHLFEDEHDTEFVLWDRFGGQILTHFRRKRCRQQLCKFLGKTEILREEELIPQRIFWYINMASLTIKTPIPSHRAIWHNTNQLFLSTPWKMYTIKEYTYLCFALCGSKLDSNWVVHEGHGLFWCKHFPELRLVQMLVG